MVQMQGGGFYLRCIHLCVEKKACLNFDRTLATLLNIIGYLYLIKSGGELKKLSAYFPSDWTYWEG